MIARAKLTPPGGWLPDREVSAEEIDRVFAAAGIVSPSSEHRAALAKAMIGYQEDSAIWALSASPAQVREKLSEVARLAKSLRKSLARLARGDASPADAIAWERLARMADRLPGGRCLPEVGKSVAFVEAVAKQAAAEIVGRDGPKGNPYRRVFIRELHAIFLAAGGKGKITKRSGQYAGRFSEMVSAALATIDGDVPTKGALVRAIEAAFGAQDGPKVA